MIRTVIADDEDLARAVAREFLGSHADVEIVAECANGFECVKAVDELKPDLLLLDIQMPKLDGFEALELIDAERLAVVFLTAYDQYAMRAFEIHAVDYLLKPFSKVRFDAALARARERLGTRPPKAEELAGAARGQGQFLERIVVKDGARVQVVPVDKLDWAEAQERLRLAPLGRPGLPQAADDFESRRAARSVALSAHPSFGYRKPGARIANRAVLERQPRGDSQRWNQAPVSRAGYARLKELLEARARSLAARPGQAGPAGRMRGACGSSCAHPAGSRRQRCHSSSNDSGYSCRNYLL